jgi:hypothetical protein
LQYQQKFYELAVAVIQSLELANTSGVYVRFIAIWQIQIDKWSQSQHSISTETLIKAAKEPNTRKGKKKESNNRTRKDRSDKLYHSDRTSNTQLISRQSKMNADNEEETPTVSRRNRKRKRQNTQQSTEADDHTLDEEVDESSISY